MLANRCHHLNCFFEEDFEQFLVYLCGGRIDQVHGLRGRHFSRLGRGNFMQGLAHTALQRVEGAVDGFQYFFALLCRARIRNQLGFLLQFLDRFTQLVA